MRWHYRDPLLVGLFPVFYALHFAEEWLSGFPEWLALFGGAGLPREAFLIINAVAFVLMVWAARAAVRHEASGWLAVGIATIVFANGLLHILGTLATRTYSPGLFTSVVLYLPLGQLALMRAWQQAERTIFARGVLAGLAAHGAVSAIAFGISRGGR